MELAVDRITGGRRQLSRHGLEGVPVLLRQVADESHVVPNGLLVGSAEELVAHCSRPLSAV
jgi:protein-disulfide isomerase-like protein with CxxC motif